MLDGVLNEMRRCIERADTVPVKVTAIQRWIANIESAEAEIVRLREDAKTRKGRAA
jgi:hypothetical protein